MKIERYRSLWGIEPGVRLDNWARWFPELKAQGYSGVELSIHSLDPSRDFRRLGEICDQAGLELSLCMHSSWFEYVGPRPAGTNASHHLHNYRSLLQLAQQLKPAIMNFHSGEDIWDVEESIKFYQGTIEIDNELGLTGRVYHETHRNRSLFSPAATQCILKAVPQLRLTADFSHWMVGGERILDISEGDRAVLEAITPHVYHIHTRIGTTQASQCPEPLNPVFQEERESFERMWKKIIQTRAKASCPDARIVFVPEYGPFPYHPIGSAKSHGEVADEEGRRLQVMFNDFVSPRC